MQPGRFRNEFEENIVTRPGPKTLLDTVDATWPAAEVLARDGWRLCRGAGGGKRVSAAVALDADGDVAAAEAGMRDWGQGALFRLTPEDDALDRALAARGYAVIDPTVIYAAPVTRLTDDRDETARIVRAELPIAAMREIWAAGGIGEGRLAVMARAPGPKSYLFARKSDRPAGVAFLGSSGDLAMIHAVEVAVPMRRKGIGAEIMRGAANLAAEWGAAWLTLAVTEANAAARGLYEGLGMEVGARYHYRIAPG